MYSVDWTIDFAFDYPVDCTPAKLRARLEYLSADWSGWENFPWRVTRSIHKYLTAESCSVLCSAAGAVPLLEAQYWKI